MVVLCFRNLLELEIQLALDATEEGTLAPPRTGMSKTRCSSLHRRNRRRHRLRPLPTTTPLLVASPPPPSGPYRRPVIACCAPFPRVLDVPGCGVSVWRATLSFRPWWPGPRCLRLRPARWWRLASTPFSSSSSSCSSSASALPR